jgi:hypothetical protein
VPSERVQRQIDRLLDEAEQAVSTLDWALVRDKSQTALAFDPDSADAGEFLAAAERALGTGGGSVDVAAPPPPRALPASFSPCTAVVTCGEPSPQSISTVNVSRLPGSVTLGSRNLSTYVETLTNLISECPQASVLRSGS